MSTTPRITITRLDGPIPCPECEGTGRIEVACRHRDARDDYAMGPDYRIEPCECADEYVAGEIEPLCDECDSLAAYEVEIDRPDRPCDPSRWFMCHSHLGWVLPDPVSAWLGLLPADETARVAAECLHALRARRETADAIRSALGLWGAVDAKTRAEHPGASEEQVYALTSQAFREAIGLRGAA